jgi:hypothetical protein
MKDSFPAKLEMYRLWYGQQAHDAIVAAIHYFRSLNMTIPDEELPNVTFYGKSSYGYAKGRLVRPNTLAIPTHGVKTEAKWWLRKIVDRGNLRGLIARELCRWYGVRITPSRREFKQGIASLEAGTYSTPMWLGIVIGSEAMKCRVDGLYQYSQNMPIVETLQRVLGDARDRTTPEFKELVKFLREWSPEIDKEGNVIARPSPLPLLYRKLLIQQGKTQWASEMDDLEPEHQKLVEQYSKETI